MLVGVVSHAQLWPETGEIEESELEKLFSDKIGLLQAFSEFIDEQTLYV